MSSKTRNSTAVIGNKLGSNVATLLELMPRGRNITAGIVRSLRKSPYIRDPWLLKDSDLYRLYYLTALRPDPSVFFSVQDKEKFIAIGWYRRIFTL